MAKKMNNLSGKKWLQYSFSIWRDINKSREERRIEHPAMFPQELTTRLIKIFSKDKGEKILDPMSGSGTTILSAYKMGKKGIGFELSPKYVELSQKRIKKAKKESDKKNLIKPKIYQKNISEISKILEENSIDLVITSPPYWDILNQRRSADRKKIKNYSDSEKDLGNIESYQEFLEKVKSGFKEVYKVLKKGKYCIVIVMDIRKKSNFYPLHIDVIKKLEEIGFELDDIVIWDRQKEYNNMKPLGFPYVFRINKVHEFILIFKK